MSLANQADVLASLNEENLFEYGELFAGLDKTEKVVWKVLEKLPPNKKGDIRITLHAYYYDVFLMPAIVWVNKKLSTVTWSFQ